MPSGITDGDLLVLTINCETNINDNIDGPAWTLVDSQLHATSARTYTLYRIWASGDGSTQIDVAPNGRAQGIVTAWRHSNGAPATYNAHAEVAATGSTLNCGATSAAEDDSLVIASIGLATTTPTAMSGYTIAVTRSTGGATIAQQQYRIQATAGAVAAASVALGASRAHVTHHVVFSPPLITTVNANLDVATASAEAPTLTATGGAEAGLSVATASSEAPAIAATGGAVASLSAATASSEAPVLTATGGAGASLTAATLSASAPTLAATGEAVATLTASTATATAPGLTAVIATIADLSATTATAEASTLVVTGGALSSLSPAMATATAPDLLAGVIEYAILVPATASATAPTIMAEGGSLATMVAVTASATAPTLTASGGALATMVAATASALAPQLTVSETMLVVLVPATATATAPTLTATTTAIAVLVPALLTATAPSITVAVTAPPVVTWYPTINPGQYATRVRLWSVDEYGNRRERIPLRVPISGTLSNNEDAAIYRSMTMAVSDPAWFTPYRDFVSPEITLIHPNGDQETREGEVFLVTGLSETITSGKTLGAVVGDDLTVMLSRSQVGVQVIPAGTDTGAAAREIGYGGGIPSYRLNIPDTGILLASAYVTTPGMTRQKAMTDLLNAASWYAPYMDWRGVITTGPWIALTDKRPARTYGTGQGLELIPPLQRDPDWDNIANTVVVRNLAPGRDPIWARARIKNPAHPLYYNPEQGIGREYAIPPIDDPNVPDAATAMTRAEAILSERANLYVPIKTTSLLDIRADTHAIIDIAGIGRVAPHNGPYRQRTWSIKLAGVIGTIDSDMYRTEAIA